MPPLRQIHDTHHLFNCTHILTLNTTLDLSTDRAGVEELLATWRDKLAGKQNREDRTTPPHPNIRVGVGRQQQHVRPHKNGVAREEFK